MNFYPRYIGDFQRDTMNLGALEVGVYTLLLDYLYASEQPLPLDMAQLKHIARCTNRHVTKALSMVLSAYFQKTPQGFTHGRALEEIAKYKGNSSKAKKAANVRWGNVEASDEHGGEHGAEHSSTDAKPEAISQKPEKPKTSKAKAPRTRARTKSAAAADGDDGDVFDKAKARTQVDALVMHLREEGVTEASAAQTSVRQWAANPAVTREVIDEGIARLRKRHNVRSPLSVLALIVPEVLDEFANPPPPLQVVRANGHHVKPLTPYQQQQADARRLTEGLDRLCAWGNDGDGDVIDVNATEKSDEPKRIKNS